MEKVEEGEVCNQVCHPKYVDVERYKEHCDYSVNRWHPDGNQQTSGSESDTPRWPDPPRATGCVHSGCRKESDRHQVHIAKFRTRFPADAKLKPHCALVRMWQRRNLILAADRA